MHDLIEFLGGNTGKVNLKLWLWILFKKKKKEQTLLDSFLKGDLQTKIKQSKFSVFLSSLNYLYSKRRMAGLIKISPDILDMEIF